MKQRFGSPGIRLQLMFWSTLVFAGLLFSSDAILYAQLQNSLSTSLDVALQLQADHIARGMSTNGSTIEIINNTGDLPEATSQASDSTDSSLDVTFATLIRILDTNGRTLRISPAFHTLIVPEISQTQPLQGTPWQGNVTTHDGQEVRLYSTAVIDNGVFIAVIQVGESLAQLHTSLQSVLFEILLIAPFVLLLGALGSYWLSARAFVPINNLIHMARQINAGDLQQRVPLPDAHDEVYRLAQTLNAMIERLEQSFTRQRRFVADASHELRTPVAAIRSLTELALLQKLTVHEYQQLLENLNTEAERLGHLISDLLALARSDEGKTPFERERIRLDVLICAVAANAEVFANERAITLQVHADKEIIVYGDEARLIQAAINLVDNAVYYTNPGGCVTLTLEKKDAWAYLTIRDTGIGIAPEHIPHIFERFYRVDPARIQTERSNSGLGLAIVEWVVLAHQGKIHVASRVGEGSTFTVMFPLSSGE